MKSPDKYQTDVIRSAAKDIVVLAGAGSGKTFTLLKKIHKLVTYRNIDPECILVLTFTRVAAENMRTRYIESQDSMYDSVPDFNTFHGFCYKIIQNYKEVYRRLGYNTPPEILEDTEYTRYITKAKMISSCSISNKKLSNPKSLNRMEKMQYDDFLRSYKRITIKDNVIDFDTLCSSICKLFTDNDRSIIPVKNRYRYLFVDEFQDTDGNQFNFIQSMSNCRRVLCGDALQNIYQFRGCTNKPLKELIASDRWFKYKLPVNYRSTKQICDYCNNESKNFKSSRYRIKLQSNVYGPDIRILKFDQNSIYFSTDLIGVLDNLKSGSTAILCRTNDSVVAISEIVKQKGFSVSNNRSTEYYISLINSILEGSDYQFDWLESRLSESDYLKYIRDINIDNMKTERNTLLLSDRYSSIQYILDDIDKLSNLMSIEDEDTMKFLICDIFDVPVPVSDIHTSEEVLRYCLNRVQDNDNKDVYIGTIHSVKGLEFDNVIVTGVGSKSFNIHQSEETENLFYTACTRAKTNLIIFLDEESRYNI